MKANEMAYHLHMHSVSNKYVSRQHLLCHGMSCN